MLAVSFVRENPDLVRNGLELRNEPQDLLDEVLELDRRRRQTLGRLEDLRRQVNESSRQVGRTQDEDERRALIQKSKSASADIGPLEEALEEIDGGLQKALLVLPNVPHGDVPAGTSDEDNIEIRTEGTRPEFDFEPVGHVDLAERLGIMDFERAAKISGSGFWLFKGAGARLQRSLINWMIELHTDEHGYEEVYPPALVRAECMEGTGQLPKFSGDSYTIESDALWLVPTAEVPVTNIHRDEILPPDSLPIYYTAYTPCFRREAGAAGTETRGLLRVHQFDKVELVKFVEPETSYAEHEKLLSDAEEVLKRLELPYRVMLLSAGDLGASAAKCYDIEVWAPGAGRWLEISSVSNFESYQARRAGIRYRSANSARPRFVHTLNGSGLALPRLVVALLENYQRADGSVVVPGVLRNRMNTDVLRPHEG